MKRWDSGLLEVHVGSMIQVQPMTFICSVCLVSLCSEPLPFVALLQRCQLELHFQEHLSHPFFLIALAVCELWWSSWAVGAPHPISMWTTAVISRAVWTIIVLQSTCVTSSAMGMAMLVGCVLCFLLFLNNSRLSQNGCIMMHCLGSTVSTPLYPKTQSNNNNNKCLCVWRRSRHFQIKDADSQRRPVISTDNKYSSSSYPSENPSNSKIGNSWEMT